MQGAAWVSLLRQIPERKHDQLMLMTIAGEIALQQVLRLEEEYLVLRGRLAGTSETNRLFFVPFDQITYLGSQKPVRDEDLEVILGEIPPPPLTEAAEPEAEAEPPPEAPPDLDPVAEAEAEKTPPNTTPAAFPNRSQLLERIRSRSKNGALRRPPPSA